MGLLSKQLMTIDTEERPTVVGHQPRERRLPNGEIQILIERVCKPDMHYNDFGSAVGILTACYGVNYESLIENSEFFEQFISRGSETFKTKSIVDAIKERQKAYGDQVGSRLIENIPGDCFGVEVYKNLPEDIQRIVALIDEPRKRDVCLIGLITALSAAFSRYRFYHGAGADLKEYSPHLITLVIGAAGTGKGLTRYGATLVGAITHKANEMRKAALAQYKKKKDVYEEEVRQRKKDKQSTDDLAEPSRPPKYCFGMSASDTTQAALVEILNENPAGGFAYDSEVDTLVQGNSNREFGGFSDVIRKVFHHEPLARQRKGEHESYIVEQPRLAVMLSGTHDQLRKLISSEYNGLFSRIWYYAIPKVFIPYTTATQQTDLIGEMCYSLQMTVLERSNLWSDELVYLKFTEQQEYDLFEAMKDKKHIEEIHGGDIGASWLRMALIVKRIAVTLAAMQSTGQQAVPDNCWKAAIGLLPAIKSHCLQALEVVRINQGKKLISKEQYDQMKKNGMTDEAIAKELDVSDRTLRRHKERWTK